MKEPSKTNYTQRNIYIVFRMKLRVTLILELNVMEDKHF